MGDSTVSSRRALIGRPGPVAVAGQPCAAPPPGADQAAARPKPHDLSMLQSSGLLERLGYEVPPPTADRLSAGPTA